MKRYKAKNNDNILFNFSLLWKIWWEKTIEVKNTNRIFQLNKRNACETDLFSSFFASKSIEWFIEDQSFSPRYALAPHSPPSSPSPISCLHLPVCVGGSSLLSGEWWGGWGRSYIILRRESLFLYKSFKTLWVLDLMNRTRKASVLNLATTPLCCATHPVEY